MVVTCVSGPLDREQIPIRRIIGELGDVSQRIRDRRDPVSDRMLLGAAQ